MDELARTKSLLEHLNVGVQKYLEKKTGVCKTELEPKRPADRSAVLSWEQRNTCFLPEDLKNFYLTTDGFLLTWSVKIENGPIAVGRMQINSISKLLRIGGLNNPTLVNPSLADLDCDSDNEDESSGLEKPTFDSRCKIFELDPCDSFGKVCLVYRESKTGMPRAKSIGSLISRPSIMELGVHLVVSCTEDLYAIINNGCTERLVSEGSLAINSLLRMVTLDPVSIKNVTDVSWMTSLQKIEFCFN